MRTSPAQTLCLAACLASRVLVRAGCLVLAGTLAPAAWAQSISIASSVSAHVVDSIGASVEGATVTLLATDGPQWTGQTDRRGIVSFHDLAPGPYVMFVAKPGFSQVERTIVLPPGRNHEIDLVIDLAGVREAVTVLGRLPRAMEGRNGLARMEDVVGTSLYAGKKSEVVLLTGLPANLAAGNVRQVFGKVPGTNLWENDGSGLQIGVSSRGLDPNRSWEMNSRQNGYDITADPFGYPEAYFTPPLEAVERIEIVRGASSLQYGPQFGGLVNYVLKKAPPHRRATVTSEQSAGTDGFFNSHTRVGGRVGRLGYNGYYHHRRGDGWRQNASFGNHTGFGSIEYAASDRLRAGFELTAMHSLVQMAGGLTDDLFRRDARTSLRPRNWFALDWLVPAFRVESALSPATQLTVNAYAVYGRRFSLFNADPVASAAGTPEPDDPSEPRTLYMDRFRNHGVETRVLHRYEWLGRASTVAAGFRYFRGRTVRQHGSGLAGSGPEFEFLGPHLDRNLHFLSSNVAAFAENAVAIDDRFTVTPGLRLDHLTSTGQGRPIVAMQERRRLIPLFGLGATYKTGSSATLYGNVSQAYRATLFNDLWRPDPSIAIDPAMKDMTGYVAEAGWRGESSAWLAFDIGGFYLRYRNRLGLLTRVEADGRSRSLWTNVSDSRNLGIESFIELDLLRLIAPAGRTSLFLSSSLGLTDARYLESPASGRRVEFAPRTIGRWSMTLRRSVITASIQYSRTGRQFSDASNTRASVDGIQGLIPAYQVWDATFRYDIGRHYILRLGVNNLADTRYFTRRATSYPGPGLIPADGRSLQVSAGFHY